MATKIDPRRIRTDLNTQARLHLCEQTVKEYAEAMEAGDEFPPIIVFFDEPNNQFILADGFHRLAAHKRIRPTDFILANQRLGTAGNARWFSCGANRGHGKRPSTDDKHFAIKQALTTDEGAKASDRHIGRHVGVDGKTVAVVRRELESICGIPQIDSRTVQRGNQTYVQNTSQIGPNRNGTDVSEEMTAPRQNILAGTSRIKFGKVDVPEGATCILPVQYEDKYHERQCTLFQQGLFDASEADVTTRDNDGFRATIGGLKECTIEFDMLYLPNDTGFTAIKNAWLTSTQIRLAALTSANGEGPVGDFSITGFSRSEPLEEAIKYSVTAKLSQWEKWQDGTATP